jgi:uncharacterized membrane protein
MRNHADVRGRSAAYVRLISERRNVVRQHMREHLKMMWGCVALIALAAVLAAAGVNGAYLALLALPCLLMMGAMVWMMVRMSGGHR